MNAMERLPRTLFSDGEFELHVEPHDEDGFHVQAAGVARALAVRDANTLLRGVPDDERGYALVRTLGGDQRVWYLTETGFNRVVGQRQVGRVQDPGIRDQVARFQKFVFGVVLPAIRRQGFYAPEATPALPMDYDEALEHLVASRRALRAVEQEVKVLEPKAEVFDAWIDNKDPIFFRTASHVLSQEGLLPVKDSENYMRHVLLPRTSKTPRYIRRPMNWIYYARGLYHARPRQRDLGYFALRFHPEFTDGFGKVHESHTLMFTPPGLVAFREVLARRVAEGLHATS